MDSSSRSQLTTTPAPAADADFTGQTLGEFRIPRRLAAGGNMGQVYLAEQISLKRKVALKVLKGDLAANATALARFKAEAEAVARATHANIVQVYAINEIGGLHLYGPGICRIEGCNLRQYLEKKGPPQVSRPRASCVPGRRRLAAGQPNWASFIATSSRKGSCSRVRRGQGGGLRPVRHLSAMTANCSNLMPSGVTMGTPPAFPSRSLAQLIDPRT